MINPEITPGYAAKSLLLTVVFNTIIATFLTIVKYGDGLFLTNFIFSQCIGLSICSSILTAHYLVKPKHPIVQLLVHLGGLTAGSLAGILLGTIFTGNNPSIFFREYGFVIQLVFLGLMFGSIIIYFFSSREKLSVSEAQVHEERIKRLTSEKRAAEADLKRLQAQIEPHFLFNTLSNILSLQDTDPEKSKCMLADLINYLRTALARTRSRSTTIGQEMELVRAYMNIHSVRMGERLRYKIEVPDRIMKLSFPPMMIQPLVENAIMHGLSPKLEGGEITISVVETGKIIRLVVTDTGVGFNSNGERGIGLANIRERLQSIYNDRGRLILEENEPCGVKAIIEVPHGPN